MTDASVLIVNLVCWGTVVIVWVTAAVAQRTRGTEAARDAVPGPPPASPRPGRPVGLIRGTFLACAIVAVAGQLVAPALTVHASWLQYLGLLLLVASAAFAVWARLTLGGAWSVAPRAASDGGLRTSGPYAVTRHPIYTGILGMVIGSALAGGLGAWLVIATVVVIAFEAKIRMEERLLLATYPDEYPGYRACVPQLIPRLDAFRRGSG